MDAERKPSYHRLGGFISEKKIIAAHRPRLADLQPLIFRIPPALFQPHYLKPGPWPAGGGGERSARTVSPGPPPPPGRRTSALSSSRVFFFQGPALSLSKPFVLESLARRQTPLKRSRRGVSGGDRHLLLREWSRGGGGGDAGARRRYGRAARLGGNLREIRASASARAKSQQLKDRLNSRSGDCGLWPNVLTFNFDRCHKNTTWRLCYDSSRAKAVTRVPDLQQKAFRPQPIRSVFFFNLSVKD